MPPRKPPRYLGKKVSKPVDHLDAFPAPSGLQTVTLTSDEVTSVCPITGQPDFYTVQIQYRPDELCIESKSLKLYLWRFRDLPGFCEDMAVEIHQEVRKTIKPRSVTVTVTQKPRGGIAIEAVAGEPQRNVTQESE